MRSSIEVVCCFRDVNGEPVPISFGKANLGFICIEEAIWVVMGESVDVLVRDWDERFHSDCYDYEVSGYANVFCPELP